MINRRVVFALGAGASNAYGFPLADELLRSAVNLEGNVGPMLQRAGFTQEQVATFTDQLYTSQLPSIDAFLEYRPEFTGIGKAVIAYYLVSKEDPVSLFSLKNPQHWYQYIYHQMKTPQLQEFSDNSLSVITFNYDRSFEYYLQRVLSATHGAAEQEVLEAIRSVPIVHVHGTLGALSSLDENHRPYEKALTSASLLTAAKSIRIVSETVPQDALFQEARSLLSEAEIVLFLGFGFHQQNVEHLLLLEVISKQCHLNGSVYGFTDSEFDQNVRPLFAGVGNNGLSRNHLTVLEFLRNHVDLLVK